MKTSGLEMQYKETDIHVNTYVCVSKTNIKDECVLRTIKELLVGMWES